MKVIKSMDYKKIVAILVFVIVIAITACIDFSDWAGGLFFMILACLVHIVAPIVFYFVFKDDEKCTKRTITYSLVVILLVSISKEFEFRI